MDDVKLALLGDRDAAIRLAKEHRVIPCPSCGERQVGFSDGVIWAQVKCEKCGARGPRAASTFDAIVGWNTRAPILSAEEMEMLEGME